MSRGCFGRTRGVEYRILAGKTHVNFELLKYQLKNLFISYKYRRIFSETGLFGFIINEVGFQVSHDHRKMFQFYFNFISNNHLLLYHF